MDDFFSRCKTGICQIFHVVSLCFCLKLCLFYYSDMKAGVIVLFNVWFGCVGVMCFLGFCGG